MFSFYFRFTLIRSSKSILISNSSKSASACVSSQKKTQWKITTKSVHFPVHIFKFFFPFLAKHIYYQSLQLKFFFVHCMLLFSRDQRLHKLVFEKDGLPDGSEVAYYARGQVVMISILEY